MLLMNLVSPTHSKTNSIVLLKGKNKLKKEKWSGLDITLNYFGCMEKEFGISKKKLTMDEALKMEGMNKFNFLQFHNKKLKSLSNEIKFPKENFEKLKLKLDSRMKKNLGTIGFSSKTIENEIVNKLEQVCRSRIRNNNKNIISQYSTIVDEYYSLNSPVHKVKKEEDYDPCFSEGKEKFYKQKIKLPILKKRKFIRNGLNFEIHQNSNSLSNINHKKNFLL